MRSAVIAENAPKKPLPTKNGAVKSKQRPTDLYDRLISYKYKVHMAAGLLPRGY